MGLRRKSTIDVIDLTKLQEKGILQKSLEIAAKNEKENLHSNKIVDLGNLTKSLSTKALFSDNNATSEID